jgi:CMP-N-acetylneuraminic acid synthetase
MNIIAIIPARSGSKGVPDKNIRLLNGKPLMAYSIEQALASKLIKRVLVSTDSIKYAAIARDYGAETPFLRPADLSDDTALDIDVFVHALNWLKDNEQYQADICVHLRPTCPVRSVDSIDKMTQIDNPHWDSVRSVSASPLTPYKMWLASEDGELFSIAQCGVPEAYNAPQQLLPIAYIQNANIDVVRARVVTQSKSMTGQRIGGYIQDSFFDIDTEDDLNLSAKFLTQKEA